MVLKFIDLIEHRVTISCVCVTGRLVIGTIPSLALDLLLCIHDLCFSLDLDLGEQLTKSVLDSFSVKLHLPCNSVVLTRAILLGQF